MIGHDTGCITTLDKSQWIGKSAGKDVDLPVLADIQFAALACGAHPYKIVQSHWHASSTETLMEKMGIDWRAKKAEFEAYLNEVQAGKQDNLYDPRRRITSGPGFMPRSSIARMTKPILDRRRRPGRPRGRSRARERRARQACSSKRRTGSAARRFCRVTPSSFRRANGPRTRSAGWSRASQRTRMSTVKTDAHRQDVRGRVPATSRRRCRTARRWRPTAAILTTGFTHFDSINKPEWGFGTFPNVVTTTQVEQMISSGRGVRCPSDGRKPKRVAILLCVGSRDRQIGREWCSKICCSVSANLAMEIREELPDCHVYVYYMDIRTFGLLETKYYWRSQEEFKVKYIKARIAEVTSNGDQLIVKGEDTLVKRPITIPFDMVVHAIGMDPNVDNMTLSAVFGVNLEQGWLHRPRRTLMASWARRAGPACSSPAPRPGRRRSTIRSRKATRRRCRRWAPRNPLRSPRPNRKRLVSRFANAPPGSAPSPAQEIVRPHLDLSGAAAGGGAAHVDRRRRGAGRRRALRGGG